MYYFAATLNILTAVHIAGLCVWHVGADKPGLRASTGHSSVERPSYAVSGGVPV